VKNEKECGHEYTGACKMCL